MLYVHFRYPSRSTIENVLLIKINEKYSLIFCYYMYTVNDINLLYKRNHNESANYITNDVTDVTSNDVFTNNTIKIENDYENHYNNLSSNSFSDGTLITNRNTISFFINDNEICNIDKKELLNLLEKFNYKSDNVGGGTFNPFVR